MASSAVQPQGEQLAFYGGKGALANHNWPVKVKNDEPLAIFDQENILRPNATIKEFELVD
ncbi:xenobiotic reductase b [Paenibacillus sp. EKM212P]|uniref:xenobiotic reductase b n=1 Tax=Paenibacillus sp. EKM212P TaxID=1683680 RepID=UPI001EEA7101|nr:xenobiotic reductase b [Paenibacillus sp. EKM212P]